MEFQNLIKASSMARVVLGNIIEESNAEGEMEKSIKKLKEDLTKLEKIIEE